MKKTIAPVAYPIIAMIVCLIIGIVLFSVGLSLQWGVLLSMLHLYCWMILAAICATISVILKVNEGKSSEQSENGSSADDDSSVNSSESPLQEILTSVNGMSERVDTILVKTESIYNQIMGITQDDEA